MKLRKHHLLLLLLLLFFSGCGGNNLENKLEARFSELVLREDAVREEIYMYKNAIKHLDLTTDTIIFVQYRTLLVSSMEEMAQIHEEKQQILEYFHNSKDVEMEGNGFLFKAQFRKVCVTLGL